MAKKALANGEAWERFRILVQAQGGDVSHIDNPEKLPTAPLIVPYHSHASGYIHMINARIVGETAVKLGAGRARKDDTIDHAVGIIISKKVGDFVLEGEKILEIHANQQLECDAARINLVSAIKIINEPARPLRLFDGVIRD